MRTLGLIITCCLFLSHLSAQKLQFNKYGWHYYDTVNSPLTSMNITSLTIDEEKNVWINTPDEYIIKISNGGTWDQLEESDEFQDNPILQYRIEGVLDGIIHKNNRGVALIGATLPANNMNNLYQLDKKGTLIPLLDTYGPLLDIHIDKDGDAYVAFHDGLYHYKMQKDGTYSNLPKFISNHRYRDIVCDKDGHVWGVCETDGYVHQYDGKLKVYTQGPSALYTEIEGKNRYTAKNIILLSDGRILISTRNTTGIAVYNGENWKGYKAELPYSSDEINEIVEGPDGSIWCSTSMSGVAAFRPVLHSKPVRKKAARTKEVGLNQDSLTTESGEAGSNHGNAGTQEFETRKIRTSRTVTTFEDSILIRVWDSQKVDGDTISLFCNGVPTLKQMPLTAQQDSFWLTLKEGYNEVLLYAHNLGSIPPNTATIIITLGNVVLNAELNSDLETSERIMIRKRRKDGSAW